MKKLSLIVVTLLASFNVLAAGRKSQLAISQLVWNHPMVQAALQDAVKANDCQLASLTYPKSGHAIKAKINCSLPADEYTGGGVYLMIEIKSFIMGQGEELGLGDITIQVQHAG